MHGASCAHAHAAFRLTSDGNSMHDDDSMCGFDIVPPARVAADHFMP